MSTRGLDSQRVGARKLTGADDAPSFPDVAAQFTMCASSVSPLDRTAVTEWPESTHDGLLRGWRRLACYAASSYVQDWAALDGGACLPTDCAWDQYDVRVEKQ